MTSRAPTSSLSGRVPATSEGWTKDGWLRTPLVVLVVYCAVSLKLKENYPFSHYPMYSNPSADRSYYIIADSDGKPLPVADLTGITCPKIGKMFRTKATALAGQLKTSRSNLTAEQKQQVGQEIFTQLRHYSQEMNKPLPARLQLQRVDISYGDGKVVETPELLARE